MFWIAAVSGWSVELCMVFATSVTCESVTLLFLQTVRKSSSKALPYTTYIAQALALLLYIASLFPLLWDVDICDSMRCGAVVIEEVAVVNNFYYWLMLL